MLLLGYAAMTAMAFISPLAPRLFWTVIMPAIPLLVVLLGFHGWSGRPCTPGRADRGGQRSSFTWAS
jgi:hypothetical protein